MSEGGDPGKRARLLPAYVEIMVAAGDLEAAELGCAELDSIAQPRRSLERAAMAAQARGLVELAADARRSHAFLRRADELWRRLAAPYESSRARELIGRVAGARGRGQRAPGARGRPGHIRPPGRRHRRHPGRGSVGARMASTLTSSPSESSRSCAWSPRETNKEIAAGLIVSVRTIDRHVSNIYAKLGVSSRAAATNYAHEHGLVRPATG